MRRLVILAVPLLLGLLLYVLLQSGGWFDQSPPEGEGPPPQATAWREGGPPAAPASSPPAAPPRPPAAAGRDLTDALLLYDGGRAQAADFGFRKAVDFYGLTRAEIDLAKTALTADLLRDEAGAYYPTVYVAGATLDSQLDADELEVLKRGIAEGGVNLLVGALQQSESAAVRTLTDGAITGSARLGDRAGDYRIAAGAPEVTRELSGVAVYRQGKRTEYALTLTADSQNVQVLATIGADAGQTQPALARHRLGKGQLFIASDNPDSSLRNNTLFENFNPIKQADGGFAGERIAQVLPYLLFVRFTAGDEAWHRDRDYANLTIDDPPLRKSSLDFAGILAASIAHNFHVTIALPPGRAEKWEPDIVDLFLSRPERLSLVQHGNNHDGYEFYKYQREEGDENEARPLADQEADIVEGYNRMVEFARETHIPFGRVMVFPYGISPVPTLSLLKRYNFLATVNSSDVPLDTDRVRGGNAHMYPAELSYGDFAVIVRQQPDQSAYPFDLFIDRPALTYLHPGTFQRNGPGAFNWYADALNELPGDVEWQSLEYIVKRLYLEKTNDDGSVDVMFFGNELIIDNRSAAERTYHLKRREKLEVPIASVTLDGAPVAYSHEDDTLHIDITIAPGATRELAIRYASGERDFALGAADVKRDAAAGRVAITVRNRGAEAGPTTVGVFDGPPERGGRLLSLASLPLLEPGGEAVVTAALGAAEGGDVSIVVDPFDLIVETDESNNGVSLATPG